MFYPLFIITIVVVIIFGVKTPTETTTECYVYKQKQNATNSFAYLEFCGNLELINQINL